ncbi:MAG TPA: GNAT family N-acetyltransferase [Thermomicrobiales bacterium]|nr:GNAT family N-acetyltransferase [Thermomicrobiales bacterium]
MAEFGPVRDNEQARRFELEVDGAVAFAAYRQVGDALEMYSTVTPPALRGRGIASALARAALDSARERGLKVIPTCWFIDQFIRDNPDYRDLLAGPG